MPCEVVGRIRERGGGLTAHRREGGSTEIKMSDAAVRCKDSNIQASVSSVM